MAVVRKIMGNLVSKENDTSMLINYLLTGDTCSIDCCVFPAWAIALIVIVCVCVPVAGLIAGIAAVSITVSYCVYTAHM